MDNTNTENELNAENPQNQNEPEELLDNLKIKIQELEDRLLRTVAESENLRKRYERTIEETREYAVMNFAKDIVTIMDYLQLALGNQKSNNLTAGVELTQKELASLFNKYKIEEITPKIGEKFDFNVHNAISIDENSEYSVDSVIEIMQPGYRLKDRLLRPAFVKVSKAPA